MRSNKSPFTRATTASSARRGLIDLAMSSGVVPCGNLLCGPVRQGNGDAAHVVDVPAMEFPSAFVGIAEVSAYHGMVAAEHN